MIRETPEGFEIGEAIFAKMSGVERSAELTRNANR